MLLVETTALLAVVPTALTVTFTPTVNEPAPTVTVSLKAAGSNPVPTVNAKLPFTAKVLLNVFAPLKVSAPDWPNDTGPLNVLLPGIVVDVAPVRMPVFAMVKLFANVLLPLSVREPPPITFTD